MKKLFATLVLLALTACTTLTPTRALTPVTVQLTWTHQAQFAGLYAADQQGYFAAEGLQVSFLQGGPDVNFMTPVVNSTAQFGIAQPADLILARANGSLVSSVATIYRRSPIVFFALADSGIKRPQDFVDQKAEEFRRIIKKRSSGFAKQLSRGMPTLNSTSD